MNPLAMLYEKKLFRNLKKWKWTASVFLAFATIAENKWEDGLKSVTDISTNTSWSIGASGFVRYGDAIVTSASITANDGETCTMDVEFTGSGRLLTTAPATPKSYT